jgi:hypothetical protein
MEIPVLCHYAVSAGGSHAVEADFRTVVLTGSEDIKSKEWVFI